jgi:hypothetical protein
VVFAVDIYPDPDCRMVSAKVLGTGMRDSRCVSSFFRHPLYDEFVHFFVSSCPWKNERYDEKLFSSRMREENKNSV